MALPKRNETGSGTAGLGVFSMGGRGYCFAAAKFSATWSQLTTFQNALM